MAGWVNMLEYPEMYYPSSNWGGH